MRLSIAGQQHPMPEILFEFIPYGQYVKVIAVDSATGKETFIIGDPKRHTDYLKKIAKEKLMRTLGKKQ